MAILKKPIVKKITRPNTNPNNPVTLPGGVTVGGSWGVPPGAGWKPPTNPSEPIVSAPITSSPGDTGGAGNQGQGQGGGRKPNPFLGQLRGQYQADMQKRKGSGIADKKALLLRFGSQELARKALSAELGSQTDPFFDLISDDPNKSTSTLAQINKHYQDQQREDLSALNQKNLWFSSGQGEQINELGRQKLTDVDTGAAGLQSSLTGIDRLLAEAETGWQSRLFDAEQQDWLQQQAWDAANPTGDDGTGGQGSDQQGLVLGGRLDPSIANIPDYGSQFQGFKEGDTGTPNPAGTGSIMAPLKRGMTFRSGARSWRYDGTKWVQTK